MYIKQSLMFGYTFRRSSPRAQTAKPEAMQYTSHPKFFLNKYSVLIADSFKLTHKQKYLTTSTITSDQCFP